MLWGTVVRTLAYKSRGRGFNSRQMLDFLLLPYLFPFQLLLLGSLSRCISAYDVSVKNGFLQLLGPTGQLGFFILCSFSTFFLIKGPSGEVSFLLMRGKIKKFLLLFPTHALNSDYFARLHGKDFFPSTLCHRRDSNSRQMS